MVTVKVDDIVVSAPSIYWRGQESRKWGSIINVRCESVVSMGVLLGEHGIAGNADRDQ